MEHLRASDRTPVPWKNGTGETREVALFPEGAGWEDFHWRLSIATVTEDGPFSSFPDIDRTLAVLDGTLRLTVDGIDQPVQRSMSPPVRFRGEARTFATLESGAVTDLNLMIRRGMCVGNMVALDGSVRADDRHLRILIGTHPFPLGGIDLQSHDALIFPPGEPMPPLPGDARGWLIRIGGMQR